MRKLLNFALFVYFLTVIFFLLLGEISTDIAPILNAFAPITPYVILSQLFVAIPIFLLKKWKIIAVVLILILISIPIFLKTYSFRLNTESSTDSVLVLSYNTSFFSVPQVFKKDYFDENYPHVAPVAREWLLQKSPDIICLQEFFNDKNSPIYHTIGFFENEGYEVKTFYEARHDNGLQRGIATFSKYPIIDAQVVISSPSTRFNAILYTDLKIDDDTVRVFNVHLKSMKLGGISVRNYLKRQRDTSLERNQQMNALIDVIDQTPYQIIIAGDFNETPYSYTISKLNTILKDGHEVSGKGFGFTYDIYKSLGVRIDHIFASDDIKFQRFRTYTNVDFSEHKPITAEFSINNNTP